jgi:hypothetical protein
MKKQSASKRFGKVSEADASWLSEQHDCVKTLWFDAVIADPFGDTFKPLRTKLKEKSFLRARKALTNKGLFEFEPKYSGRDHRVVECWMVRNLHGTCNSDYWGQSEPNKARSDYEIFLLSDYWQGVRQQVLERDSHTCQACGATSHLHVHHLTYAHHGEEHLYLEDLITLCKHCHAKEHGIEGQNP